MLNNEQLLVDSRRDLVPLELLYLIKKGHNTGYQLKKAYDEYFGITVSFGTIYPLLHSLHKGGFLNRKRLPGRAKFFYTLNRDGERVLELNASFVQTFSKALNHHPAGRGQRQRPVGLSA